MEELSLLQANHGIAFLFPDVWREVAKGLRSLMGILGNNFLSGKKKVMEKKRSVFSLLDIGLRLYEGMVFCTVAAIV